MRYLRVPWGDLEPSDLTPAGSGLWTRDLRDERQLALRVVGSLDMGLTLGLLAIRCIRTPYGLEPLTVALPDTVALEDA